MAVISPERIALIGAVNETEKVDMSVERFFAPSIRTFNTKYIEYEIKDNKAKTATYKSFAERAEVVERNGVDVVRLEPFMINIEVPRSQIELYQKDFGANPYVNVKNKRFHATKEALYDYAHAGALRRRKKLIAGILQNLKLTKDIDLIDADFNIDTTKYAAVKTDNKWDSADAPVLQDLANLKAKSKGSIYVMNVNTYTNMIKNGDLKTASDSSGVGKNFELNTNADATKEFYRIGRVLDPLAMGDVYIWESKDENETYLEDGYVVCTTQGVLEGLFGGVITRDSRNQMALIAAEFDVYRASTVNPVTESLIYVSAPMYAPRGTKKIAVTKVY